MKFIISLAFKNLFRYRRRTIITAIAIAMGLAIFIWVDGFLLGAETDSNRNLVEYETGVIKLLDAAYWEEIDYMPLKYLIEDPEPLLKKVRDLNLAVTPRVAFQGEIFSSEGSMPLRFYGIDPETDDTVYRLEKTMSEESHYLSNGNPEIMIGRFLADDLEVKEGDTLEIRARTKYGAYVTFEVTIAAILDCPNPVVNNGTGFLPLPLIDEELEMEGAVTELVIGFMDWEHPAKNMERVSKAIGKEYPEVKILSWEEIAQVYLAVGETKGQVINLMLFLVFVIAAVGITNTMLMAIYERIREIGMMRAMGMVDSSIRMAFLIEAGGIGLIGSLIGVALGSLFNYYMVNWGMDVTAFLGDMDIGYRISGVFRGAWRPTTIVVAFIFGTFISMLVSLIPSRKALKMEITDCLRYQ